MAPPLRRRQQTRRDSNPDTRGWSSRCSRYTTGQSLRQESNLHPVRTKGVCSPLTLRRLDEREPRAGPPNRTATATYVQMMVSPVTFTALAVALLAASSGGAAPSGASESRVLWQGPVLAGDAVIWGEEAAGTGSIHRWTGRRGERAVYSSDSLALTRPLAASRTLLAFERTYPSCPPQPNRVCPQAEDALVGPPAGPFRTLVRPRTCSLPGVGNTLALDAGSAAYVVVDCASERLRVLVRDVGRGGRPLVLRAAALSSGCCHDVAIAGQFVAWADDRAGDVTVYDRLARRVAYRARIAGDGVEFGFDLQPDGKLAVAYRLVEFARTVPTTVAWFSPSAPHPHVLPLRGRDTRVRIANDRLALERFLTPKRSAFVVADLAGHVRTVMQLVAPTRLRSGFDFDGRHIVWASDQVISTRVDCPPPGQGRPCFQRETGVTTIWIRAAETGPPRRIVRLPFVDTVAHGS